MDEVTFDGISECYDASREIPEGVIQQLVGFLEEIGLFQERQVLVDVACCIGLYLKPFASVFAHAIGLDISKRMSVAKSCVRGISKDERQRISKESRQHRRVDS